MSIHFFFLYYKCIFIKIYLCTKKGFFLFVNIFSYLRDISSAVALSLHSLLKLTFVHVVTGKSFWCTARHRHWLFAFRRFVFFFFLVEAFNGHVEPAWALRVFQSHIETS